MGSFLVEMVEGECHVSGGGGFFWSGVIPTECGRAMEQAGYTHSPVTWVTAAIHRVLAGGETEEV